MTIAKPQILFQSVFKDGTGLVATDTDADAQYDVANLIDYRQGTSWKAASFGTKTIEVDMGAAVPVDSLFILNHNLGTAVATVSVESSTTGAWGGEEVEQLAGFVPTDDLAIYKNFTQATVRYWRLKIITAAVVPFLAVALLGERLDFERWSSGNFKAKPQSAKGETNTNVDGLFINSVVASYRLKYNVQFVNLTQTWVDTYLNPAIETHLKKGLPFAWVWDITNHPTEIYYNLVPLNTEVAPSFNKSRMMFTLKMRGVTE